MTGRRSGCTRRGFVAGAASVAAALGTLGVLWIPASSPAPPVSAAAVPPCRDGVITHSRSPGPFIGLYGVAALSARDAWSVGYYIKADASDFLTLIEHWNGQSWAVVPSPPAALHGVLEAVAAVSPADVWAVGYHALDSAASPAPLVDHWTGSAWSRVPTPSMQGSLDGISVVSANDIWAVGHRRIDNGMRPEKTLIEHWNGSRWQRVPSPTPTGYGDGLAGVTAAGPDDVWATGLAGKNLHDSVPLAEHWNGHAWSAALLPTLGFTSAMRGISAHGAGDVWAVGWYDVETSGGTQTFTLTDHWNGHRWSIVPSPSPAADGFADDTLNGTVAVSAHAAWAAGANGANTTFVLRWNGRAWTALPSPYLRRAVNVLWSLSAPAANDIWAAGGGYKTLVMHICPVSGT